MEKAVWWQKQRLESGTLKMEEGLQVKESGRQLDAEEDKEMGSSLEPPERNNSVHTFILAP